MESKISQADKRREIIKTLDSAYPVSSEKATLAILGAGAWGSALAKLAGHNQHEIHLWSRSLNVNLSEILQNVDIIVSAVSTKGVNETVEKIKQIGLSEKVIIITATKGLDPATRRTPSQIWETNFPNNSVVVLSGPNLSKEINDKLPTATVVASKNKAATTTVQNIFASGLFRVYSSPDPIGTELGGTLKNIIAIAAGVCDGLELGTNAKSALLTRALTEMIRVGNHLGGQTETFFGLSGLGDMLATCSSSLSRNYRVGYGLAQGKSLEKILEELQGTAEGVNTTNVLIDIAYREEIRVPISHQVFLLLNGKISPEEAVVALMERDLKPEFYDFL